MEKKTIKIESKAIKNVDIVVAFDVSNNKVSINNIKGMLSLFNSMVKDYNCDCHIILFGDDILLEFNIEDIETLDEFVLLEQNEVPDYNIVFNYAKDKAENQNWDIFKVYCITDGNGVFPDDSEFDTIWVTINKDIEKYPFGQVLAIQVGGEE